MNERTKKVYDAFEQKQFRNKLELKRKQEALYAAIPKLAELDHAINLQGIRMTREVSRKNPDAISEFRQSVEALKKQKEALLIENGYPLDYLTLRYDCPICKDTGYVDGQVCSCLKHKNCAHAPVLIISFCAYEPAVASGILGSPYARLLP